MNKNKTQKEDNRSIAIKILIGIWMAAIGFWLFFLLELYNLF